MIIKLPNAKVVTFKYEQTISEAATYLLDFTISFIKMNLLFFLRTIILPMIFFVNQKAGGIYRDSGDEFPDTFGWYI